MFWCFLFFLPPHLALNPPYLFFWVLVLFLFFLVFVGLFLGGFKGQVRWPEGPPHLALNSLSCFFWFFLGFLVFCFGSFPFFVFNRKTLFSPQKGHFLFIFHCLPFFLHSLFWPPPFSLFLSLSLSFSFFLPSFLSFFFAFFCFLAFVSFFLLVSSLLLFHEKNNIKIFNYKVLFINPFSFLLVSSLLFLSNPLSLSLFFFPDFKFCFCSTSVFFFKKCKFKKHQFFKKNRGCNITVFLWTCVLQNVKSYRFLGGHFFAFFGCFSKNTIKIGISAHFSKQQNTKQWHVWKLLSGPSWKLLSGPSWKLLSGPSWVRLKNANLDQIITSNVLRAIWFSKKMCWNPYFYSVFLAIGVLEKANLDQIITSKTPKLGPDNNSTAYIHMLWSHYFGQVWPFSKSIFWPSQRQKLFGQGHFRTIKMGGFQAMFFCSVIIVCVCVCVCVCFFLFPIIWQFSKNSLFQKKGAKIGFSNFLCFKFKFWKFSFFRSAKTL